MGEPINVQIFLLCAGVNWWKWFQYKKQKTKINSSEMQHFNQFTQLDTWPTQPQPADQRSAPSILNQFHCNAWVKGHLRVKEVSKDNWFINSDYVRSMDSAVVGHWCKYPHRCALWKWKYVHFHHIDEERYHGSNILGCQYLIMAHR